MTAGAFEPSRPDGLHPYWDAPQPEEGEWLPYSEGEVTSAAQRVLALIAQDARVLTQLSGALALALLGRHQALDALAGVHAGVRDFLHLATWQAQQIIPPADEEGKPNR